MNPIESNWYQVLLNVFVTLLLLKKRLRQVFSCVFYHSLHDRIITVFYLDFATHTYVSLIVLYYHFISMLLHALKQKTETNIAATNAFRFDPGWITLIINVRTIILGVTFALFSKCMYVFPCILYDILHEAALPSIIDTRHSILCFIFLSYSLLTYDSNQLV